MKTRILLMAALSCSSLVGTQSRAQEKDAESASQATTWAAFERRMIQQNERDRIEGISYILGGALTTVGGTIGTFQTKDAAESLVYTVFQNVGIASVGLGYFKWRIGDEDRRFYRLLDAERGLTASQRQSLMRRYQGLREEALREERVMRAILHGLLAVTNIVAAAREDQAPVRNGLYFLGSINAFASISFTF